ncbi:hypothetical protein OS493_039711, partial [Desmophyllum pertusum]
MNVRWCATNISRWFSSKADKDVNGELLFLVNVDLRYQPKAGPDGGDGGRGGVFVLIADYSVKEFAHLPKHIKLRMVEQVPLGTVVKAHGHVIADMTAEGETFVASREVW